MSDIQITPLTRAPRDVTRFLKVSYPIYYKDPNWVAPLLMDLKKVFTDENPLFQHATMQLWLATRDGHDIGRIAAIIGDHFNRRNRQDATALGSPSGPRLRAQPRRP